MVDLIIVFTDYISSQSNIYDISISPHSKIYNEIDLLHNLSNQTHIPLPTLAQIRKERAVVLYKDDVVQFSFHRLI
jgi:hypothetical protein